MYVKELGNSMLISHGSEVDMVAAAGEPLAAIASLVPQRRVQEPMDTCYSLEVESQMVENVGHGGGYVDWSKR
jgi:hypothetical protein